MNIKMFKRNLWSHVQLNPVARRFDDYGRELPPIDDDWLVDEVCDAYIRISNTRTSHFIKLGKDHIRNYDSNPQRDWDGRTHGFLNLRMQAFISGRDAGVRPL